MNTILTDDEIDAQIEQIVDPVATYGRLIAYARAVEAAVLAKLAWQEPVCWAFQHQDGSWHDPSLTEHSAGMKPLYAAPQQADRQRAPEGWKLVPVEPTPKMTSAGAVKLNQVSGGDFEALSDEIDLTFRAILAAAPEAPAQASAVEERDRKDAERYRFIRANGRYVVKVSGESLHCGGHLPFNADKFGPAIDKAIDEARAALAQKGGAA